MYLYDIVGPEWCVTFSYLLMCRCGAIDRGRLVGDLLRAVVTRARECGAGFLHLFVIETEKRKEKKKTYGAL